MQRQFSRVVSKDPRTLAVEMNAHLAQWTNAGWMLETVAETRVGMADGMEVFSLFWRKDDA